MKHWPTIRTNLSGVSQRALDEWHYWKMRVGMEAKNIEWLKRQGDFPDGLKSFESAQKFNLGELEKVRLRCRRQDIESRWYLRKTFRRSVVVRWEGWHPTPMGYDQYLGRNRKLAEDL